MSYSTSMGFALNLTLTGFNIEELSRQDSPEKMMSFLLREASSDLMNFQAEIENLVKENSQR